MTDKPLIEMKRLTDEEFRSELRCLISKDHYPLEWISIIQAEDDQGVFYIPAITLYVEGETAIAWNGNGYQSRKDCLAYVGHQLDLVMEERAKFNRDES